MPNETNRVPVADQMRDRIDSGVATLREQQATTRVDNDPTSFAPPSLEDVDGIGESTAEKLREAGVDTPEELSRLTPRQLTAVDGVGQKRADSLAETFQFGSQTRFERPEADPQDVREAHQDRSQEARTADRSFNAKITLDENKWLNNPEEYDFPGVDTIPEQRRAERARTAAQRSDNIDRVSAKSLAERVQGRFSGGEVSVDAGAADPVATLAHEVGHGIEPRRGFGEEEIFGDSEELRDQAAKLSARRRFTVNDTDPETMRDRIGGGTQDEDAELFADVVGAAIEEPRAARREAPDVVSKIEQEFSGVLPGKRG